MSKFKEIFYESIYSPSHINVYHGGGKWQHYNAEIRSPKKGRFESGIGINTTNDYRTARKHSKGSKVVSILWIDKNITLSDDVFIPLDELVNFLSIYVPKRYRIGFISDVNVYAKRLNTDKVKASIVNNLIVNYEIGGKAGVRITQFLVDKGVDASMDNHSGDEDWLIIHNPKVIKKVIHTKPSDIDVEDYTLPRIKDQMSS